MLALSSSLALLGWEFTQPAFLLGMALPLALLLLCLRPARPVERATGALVIWQELAQAESTDGERRRRRIPPAMLLLCAALVCVLLALAGPRRVMPPLESHWTLVVDRSAGMQLRLAQDEQRTRLDAALERALAWLDEGAQQEDEFVWSSPGRVDLRLARGERPPAAWLASARPAERPRWPEHDLAGVLWITDRAPERLPERAGLFLGGGEARPGPISAGVVWDGGELLEVTPLPRVLVVESLPSLLEDLARAWAESAGFDVQSSAPTAELRLLGSTRAGEGGERRLRAGRDGWSVGLTLSASTVAVPADALDTVWLAEPDSGAALVLARPGVLRLAFHELGGLAGDPAAFAVSWARLFEEHALPPDGVVPYADRRAADAPRSLPPTAGSVPSAGARVAGSAERNLALLGCGLGLLALLLRRGRSRG